MPWQGVFHEYHDAGPVYSDGLHAPQDPARELTDLPHLRPRSSGPARATCVAAGLLLPVAASAQRWQVDVGATSVRYDTAAAIGAASAIPQYEWTRDAVYALLNGNLSVFEGGIWAAQAWGDVSLLSRAPRRLHPLRFEAAASLGGAVQGDGYSAFSGRGELRAHLANGSAGGWFGVYGATGATTDSAGGASAVGPTAGGWFRRRPVTATALWTPLFLEGDWFQELDVRVSAPWGPVDVATFGGWRSAPAQSARDPEAWIGAAVAVWVAPRSAIVVSAASYASDPLQALPAGRYISLVFRVAGSRPSVWAPSWTGRTVYAPERDDGALLFRVADAQHVAIAGDWTGWQPVPLAPSGDGAWALRPQLARGVYRFNLIVDGDQWIVPDGFATVDDGFGGKAGLLVVP